MEPLTEAAANNEPPALDRDPRAEAEEAVHPPDADRTLRWITVLAAADLDYRLSCQASRWTIHVPREQTEAARREIRLYETENAGWPPVSAPALPAEAYETWGAFWGVFFLVAFYVWLGPYREADPILRAAGADAGRVLAGEWWRVVTSLMVHASARHLAANLVGMALLGHAVCRLLGSGLGWILVLAASGAGNAVTAWWAESDHVSVGGSTAVFAALGILAGCRSADVMRRTGGIRGLREKAWIPLCAGAAVLALFGASPGSDLAAHLFGFLAGALVALPFGWLGPRWLPARAQTALRLLGLAAVVGCWILAFEAAGP